MQIDNAASIYRRYLYYRFKLHSNPFKKMEALQELVNYEAEYCSDYEILSLENQ